MVIRARFLEPER